MDTQPKEDVEEDDMQEVIHTMTACKAYEVLPRRCGVEGEVIGGNEVIDETDDIANGIGDVDIYP